MSFRTNAVTSSNIASVDDDVQAADLSGPLYDFDSSQREILEQKKAMKKRGLKSPDDGLLALTSP